ncbi:MAG: RIP metalloprotease RseP [Saprospiraceae bacterium]|nr:RIP metalloprotease RseP [Saprospiraceae bacterium]
MDKINLVLQLILSLSILVVLHEFGHYLPAKWFKTRVEKFYLFFDPYFSLFKKKIGDTEWGIGWIPFGGYVKIAGMIDESMDKEQMKQPVQPWEFRAKPAWQRLIIMLGGVTVNFILGIVIFAGMSMYWGDAYVKTSDAKYGIEAQELGKTIGLKDGDVILGTETETFDKVNPGVVIRALVINGANQLKVLRDGQEITMDVSAETKESLVKFDNKDKGLFGLRIPTTFAEITKKSVAEKYGLDTTMMPLTLNGKSIAYQHELIKGLSSAKYSVGKFSFATPKDTIVRYIPIPGTGKLGVALNGYDKFLTVSTEKYGPIVALQKGYKSATSFLGDQLKAFGKMFSGQINPKESLGSVISMATMFKSSWDWAVFWRITASLSILLAFFNLLPIPALDGGYVMFLIWELITGKQPSDKFMEIVNYIGFLVLISLMIFALGLDISRLF